MSKNNQPKDKGQNKLQVFFMVVLIPAIFAVILAVVVLYYVGFNVGGTFQQAASMLPFIDDETEEQMSDEEHMAQVEHENQSYLQQIQQLESEIEAKDTEIASLEAELFDQESEEVLDEEETEEVTADLNDIVKTLEDMTASKAADIISELPEEEAVTYLRMMRVNNRSNILSRVDPEVAAQLLIQMEN
ncbi:hypothetical protein CR194_08060 [Salipaludibacillus keqinensis]|uniref:Magnesium transporter MgtE intracellular domain-containing protein n=1 Tax=Salipaludibacillus keqinensis TaxID=2045207 RepID=A0A323TGX0_9BACI|nr:hypothetical protein [Salipaludibacillus keqinensis]PYZ93144.1 hypothetical protein CR194_08060 [Salipaludibacillus keqinensis]